MSGIATAVVGSAVISGYMGNKAAGKAADASRDAAATQAGAQRESLDYLKQTEYLPQQMREGALRQIGGMYGLGGGYSYEQQQMLDELENLRMQSGVSGASSARIQELKRLTSGFEPAQMGNGQQALINQAQSSPLYGAIMGTQQAGEEAIMRQAGATGGLRSGNVQSNLYQYNQQLQSRALQEAYGQQMQGLQGLAQLPSYAPQIAQGLSGIGATQAGGMLAAGQAQQQGYQAMGNAAQQGIGQYLQYKSLQGKI